MRVAAVIGSPVVHSLSPALHNAAFDATGLDWRLVALEVAPGEGAAAGSLGSSNRGGVVISEEEARHQSLASCGAALIAFSLPRGRVVNSYGGWDRYVV